MSGENERTHDEADLLARVEAYRFVADIAAQFINLPMKQLSGAVEEALSRCASYAGADRAYFLACTKASFAPEIFHEHARGGIAGRGDATYDSEVGALLPRLIQLVGEEGVVPINDASSPPNHFESMKRFFSAPETAACLLVSVQSGDGMKAVLGLDQVDRTREWDQNAVTLLEGIGRAFVSAVSRKQQMEALAFERSLMSSLMENIPDAIYFKDAESRFTRISKAQAKQFSLSSPDEAQGKTDADFFSEEHARSAFEDEQEIIRTGEPIIGKVEKETWHDRPVSWASTTKMPLRDETGKIQGTFGISRDITESKLMGQAVKEHAKLLSAANDALRMRNQELDEFTFIASHDLQEPLRKISAFSDLLSEDLAAGDAEAVRHDVEVLSGAARRMQRLVQDLLALSRSGRQAMEFEVLELNDVVEDALDSLSTAIEERNAKVQCGPLPRIRGDRTLLTQLFQNLIGNGIKFCDKDTPHIEIGADPDEICQIYVADNGIGLKEEYAEQIFSPFKRLHGRDEYEGTGIGLSICRKIVERHGGRVWVASELGQGARFIFDLDPGTEGEAQ